MIEKTSNGTFLVNIEPRNLSASSVLCLNAREPRKHKNHYVYYHARCSASNANPNIGYPFLGINPGGCPIWGFPRCFRNFVNGSFPQLGLSIPLFLSLVFFIVVSILVMMSLCRILRSFIGYIVVGDIGAFPLRGLFPLCLLALALDVSVSPRHTDICPSLDLLKLPG